MNGHNYPRENTGSITCSKYSDTVVLKPWTKKEARWVEFVMDNGDKGSDIVLEEVKSFLPYLFICSEDGVMKAVTNIGSL